MKKALLVIYISPNFAELIRVARLLKRSETYQCVFYFDKPYPNIAQDLAVAEREGFLCLGADGQVIHSRSATQDGPEPHPAATPPPDEIADSHRPDFRPFLRRVLPAPVRSFLSRAFWGLLGHIVRYGRFVPQYRRASTMARRVIGQEKPDILIFGEDNVEYFSAVWIKTGHQRGIPSVIVPYAIAQYTEAAEGYWHVSAHRLRRLDNWLVSLFYPRWMLDYKGRKLVRLPAPAILLNEWLGLAPPNPWVLHSGYADAIAVESQAMRDYYLQEGLPEQQLVVTGAAYDDVLAERLQNSTTYRKALYETLGLPPDRPMILCAFPPDRLNDRKHLCDFSTLDDLVVFWMETLSVHTKTHHVVISLHPTYAYEAMQYIEQWGVKIARQSIAELIPLCDIFVASISSTIRLATACGKPVVNYDVYRYSYTDFAQTQGVLTFAEQQAFVETLQRLTTDPALYAEIRACQERDMHRWGLLDGQSGARILHLLGRLIDQAKAAHR